MCDIGTIKLARVTGPYDSDLPDVIVDGFEAGACSECGEEYFKRPRGTEASERVLAALLGKSTRLAPSEVRFLRRSLGMPARDFAETLGVSPEQLSRWENAGKKGTGKVQISATADRLVRAFVAAKKGLALPELRAIDASQSAPLQLRLTLGRQGWREVAAKSAA